MKWFILPLFFVFSSYSGFAQTVPATVIDSLPRQPASYKQTIAVADANADELYSRAREWVALTFEDVHQVIQLEDPARHLLIGSGYTMAYSYRNSGKVKNAVPLWFRFRVETRPGRYRVEFTDFGSVRGFLGGQFASGGLAEWISSGSATREASGRHSPPGETMTGLLGEGEPEDQHKVKLAVDEALGKLFKTLYRVETAPAVTW